MPTVDADRHRSVDRHAAHDAWLVAVIINRLVLRRAIVPDHHIACRPAPPHRVFQPRHVILQHGKQMRRVCRTDAKEPADEITEDDGPFPGQRMHLHDRVLGLVDRRFEDGLVALHLPGRGVGTRYGIVVDVAVERPQLIGEAAQHGRQRLVGGDRIGPHGVAADGRDHHAAQDGEQRERRNEGNVRVPAARPGVLGVDVEDSLGAGEWRHGRVRNERAQEPCEGLMLGLVEMALAAEKHDQMAQQGIADRRHCLGRQVAGQPYTVDFGANRRRDRANVEGGAGGVRAISRRERLRHILDLLIPP